MTPRKIKIDFETRSLVNLKKSGAFEYSLSPTTGVTCMGFKEVGTKGVHLFDFHQMQKPWEDQPEKFKNFWLGAINGPYIFSAHNAFFEQCIYKNVLVNRLGWPEIPIKRWRCTAAKAAACALPRNLEGAGAALNLKIQKDKEGFRAMMKTCKPTAAWNKWLKFKKLGKEPEMFWTPETAPEDFKTLYQYCKIDVLAEEELDSTLPDLTPKEQELWFLDQKVNFRGVQVDMPSVKKILEVMTAEQKTMGKELDELTLGLVKSGNARNQILEYLKLEGIKLPDLKSKTVDDFLAAGKMSPDAKALLKIRKALSKSSTRKYEAFAIRAASDGRVRDLLLFHGASTGRWGGKGVQPQNFPRGTIKDIGQAIGWINQCDAGELKLLYGENLMPLFSSVLRGMFIATPGKELFVDDYNAIETRVLWWLSDHAEGLKIFSNNRDPYREMAAKVFNKSILEITDAQRQVGKAIILGCGYQMGAKKFKQSSWDVYRAEVSEELALISVSTYREVHWPVTELWTNYNNVCIAAIENPGEKFRVGRVQFFVKNGFLLVQLPGGRCLFYANPAVAWEATPFGFNTKRVTYWAVNSLSKKWTLERTYGGKITENVVQAVSRDILAEAMVRAEEQNYAVLMHSHDELVGEKDKGLGSVEEFQKIMLELPSWADGLPLKSGGWSGPRYRK